MKNIRQLVTYFTALLGISLLLSGCGSAPKTEPAAGAQATLTITEPTLSPIPSPASRLTVFPTLSPDKNINPTADAMWKTVTAISIPLTETQEAYNAFQEATGVAKATLEAQFPGSCQSGAGVSVSPDGKWLTNYCGDFLILSRDGSKKISISQADVSPPDYPVTDIFPIHWSNDSHYVFFSTYRCCVDSDVYSTDGSLYRVDTLSEKWSKIIDGYYYYSFSPTDRRLLYIIRGNSEKGEPTQFHIVDQSSGTEETINLQNFEQAGHIVWSPDGKNFVATAKIGSDLIENSQFALFFISIDEQSIVNILPLSDRDVYASNWSKDNIITIADCDNMTTICDKTHLYDANAKQFLSATPTP